jgi:hypothetical protein
LVRLVKESKKKNGKGVLKAEKNYVNARAS